MKALTPKEEEIMERYWDFGPLHIKELQSHYNDPKPHVNTLSTLVKILEEKGFLSHKVVSPRCFLYFALVTRKQYRHYSLKYLINRYFGKSSINLVSTLVKEENLSVDELKDLIKGVENDNK